MPLSPPSKVRRRGSRRATLRLGQQGVRDAVAHHRHRGHDTMEPGEAAAAARAAGHALVKLTLAPSIGDKEPLGSMLIELYSDVCPNTCAQFIKGVQGTLNNGYKYQGSPIHRVVRHAYIQGGDVLDGTGKGNPGFTIPDETYAIKHDGEGLVGLATAGEPHTGNTQFYITLKPLPWLDGKRVVFGRVVDAAGLDLLQKVEALPQNNERPVPDVVVSAAQVVVE